MSPATEGVMKPEGYQFMFYIEYNKAYNQVRVNQSRYCIFMNLSVPF